MNREIVYRFISLELASLTVSRIPGGDHHHKDLIPFRVIRKIIVITINIVILGANIL